MKANKANSVEKKVVSTAFQIAAVRNGHKGRDFGLLGKEAGVQGKKFGNHGGRPKNKSDKLNLAEIIAFLKSKKLNPVYPERVRGKRENRRSFKKKCKQFRLVKNILHRKVKVRGVEQYVRVA